MKPKSKTCPCCAGRMVEVRGKDRGKEPTEHFRTVCPTCLAEFKDWIDAHAMVSRAVEAVSSDFDWKGPHR